MVKRLRVLAGPSADPVEMTDITQLVNSPTAFVIKSDDFEGRIVTCIKDFHPTMGEQSEGGATTPKDDGDWYFGRADRQGVTWSIQVQGRFLKPHPASEILFGNVFDRPLKLPWGSGAALKFMSYIDPTLTHDLGSQTTPWALSPLVSTMPYLDLSPAGSEPPFPLGTVVTGSPRSSSPLGSSSPPGSSSPGSSGASSSGSSPEASRPASKAPSRASSIKSLKGRIRAGSRASLGLGAAGVAGGMVGKEKAAAGKEKAPSRRSSIASLRSRLSGSSSKSSSKSQAPSRAGTRPPTPVDERADADEGAGADDDDGDVPGHAQANAREELPPGEGEWTYENASERKAHFAAPAAREGAVLGPDTVLTCDFAYGFLSFSPTIALVLPGGLSFDLMRYWDGQPVRFVCCERASGGGARDANGVREPTDDPAELPWGKVLWSVCIELVED